MADYKKCYPRPTLDLWKKELRPGLIYAGVHEPGVIYPCACGLFGERRVVSEDVCREGLPAGLVRMDGEAGPMLKAERRTIRHLQYCSVC